MTRCRCGRWTNYGLTCTYCRVDPFPLRNESSSSSNNEEEEEVEEVPLDEYLESEEGEDD